MPPQMAEPFRFSTTLTLRESTGLRAVSLAQLLKGLRQVPGSVIYHHTHHYLREHHYLRPEPPNDFAYWVTEVLGDKDLGEQLASVDTIQFASLRALREQLIEVIEGHLRFHAWYRLRRVGPPEAFHFVKAVSVVLRTPYQAATLPEFVEGLRAVTLDSVYFHMFEARLRLERGPNDFSLWFEGLGESRLAKAVASLDPYTHTLDELRQTIIRLVQARLSLGA